MLVKSLASLIAALLLAIPAHAQTNTTNTTSPIATNIQAISDLTNLVALIKSPGYEDIVQKLNSNVTYTLFAPSNAALTSALQSININNTDYMKALLNYHIGDGNFGSQGLKDLQFVPTELRNGSFVHLNGTSQVVLLAKDGNSFTVNNVTVARADIASSNGFIHIINDILVPPMPPLNVSASQKLNEFVNAVNRTNLTSEVNSLAGSTIFAPRDDAFNNANFNNDTQLADALKFHIVNGTIGYSTTLVDGMNLTTVHGANLTVSVGSNGAITVNGARVVKANVLTSSGVIHIIDTVLIPPYNSTNNTNNNPSGGKNGAASLTEHTGTLSTFALSVMIAVVMLF